MKLTLRATWMSMARATASPLCCTRLGGSQCRSPQTTAPRSTETEPGSQVERPPYASNYWIIFICSLFFISSFKLICFPKVHTGKLDSKFKATLVNATQWQYYGTPNVTGSLKMTWDTSLVRADEVNLELWGYKEEGEHSFAHTWNTISTSREKKKVFILGFHLACAAVRLSSLFWCDLQNLGGS